MTCLQQTVAVDTMKRHLKRPTLKPNKILMSNYVDRKQLYSESEVSNFPKDNSQNRWLHSNRFVCWSKEVTAAVMALKQNHLFENSLRGTINAISNILLLLSVITHHTINHFLPKPYTKKRSVHLENALVVVVGLTRSQKFVFHPHKHFNPEKKINKKKWPNTKGNYNKILLQCVNRSHFFPPEKQNHMQIIWNKPNSQRQPKYLFAVLNSCLQKRWQMLHPFWTKCVKSVDLSMRHGSFQKTW